METGLERWVQIVPEKNYSYRLYDPVAKRELGQMLFDRRDNWIYDGSVLTTEEQEDITGAIEGDEKEITKLLATLNRTFTP